MKQIETKGVLVYDDTAHIMVITIDNLSKEKQCRFQ